MKPFRVTEMFEVKEEKGYYEVERTQHDDGEVEWEVAAFDTFGHCQAMDLMEEESGKLIALVERTREPL